MLLKYLISKYFSLTINILGWLGLEPRTDRLKAEHSTIELPTLNTLY